MFLRFFSILFPCLLLVSFVSAADIGVGDKAPEWKDLPGTDGKTHSCKDLSDKKGVVVAFICNHCPVAQAYEKRLIALQDKYSPKGVELVAINVNLNDQDRLEKMIEHAQERKFNFTYLFDKSQKIGREFNAKTTPHVFLLDKEGKIVYAGAIDDNMNPEKVEKTYLADAIDSLLDGKEIKKSETKAIGCSIKYE